MKKAKSTAAFLMAALISVQAGAPAYATEEAAAYTIRYSQIEETVLNNNLQVDSNERTIGALDNQSELKEKYDAISKTLSQTSSTLTAIIGNPQASPDLKTVAQGTNVALASLAEMLNAQEDASEDDYELTELQVELSDHQLVRSAQSLFSVYYQLQYNIGQLENTRVVLSDSLTAAQSQYDAGLGTSVPVADAKAALSVLDNNLADLQNQSKSVEYQMNQLLGRAYSDPISFGTLPEPDTAYVDPIQLTNDILAAQEASYKVQISNKERAILSDDTTDDRDKRQIKSNEAELERQSIAASLQNQYDKIRNQRAVLAAEQQKVANAKLKADQAQKKYNLGVLSKIELNQAKNDFFTERTAVETASATLFWQIESYKWIIKGLPAS